MVAASRFHQHLYETSYAKCPQKDTITSLIILPIYPISRTNQLKPNTSTNTMDTERWSHPQAFDNWIHTDNNM